MSGPPREVEGVLLVTAEDPEAVGRRLAALEAVDRFELVARPAQRIHDVNLDTGDGALGAAQVTLRVRELHGRPLLTLKADARRSGLAAERLELEAPWSAEALRSVLAELERRGVRVPGAAGAQAAAAAEAGAGEPAVGIRAPRRRRRTTGREPRTGSDSKLTG